MKSLGRHTRVRRAAALALGAGVIGSLAFAGPTMAAPPATGVNCRAGTPTFDGGGQAIPGTGPLAADNGKIAGHGSIYARRCHIAALIPGYTDHVCGPVPDEHSTRHMILYNEHQVGPPAQAPGLPTWPLASTNVPGFGTIGMNTTGIQPPNARVGDGAGMQGNKCGTAPFHMADAFTIADYWALVDPRSASHPSLPRWRPVSVTPAANPAPTGVRVRRVLDRPTPPKRSSEE